MQVVRKFTEFPSVIQSYAPSFSEYGRVEKMAIIRDFGTNKKEFTATVEVSINGNADDTGCLS